MFWRKMSLTRIQILSFHGRIYYEDANTDVKVEVISTYCRTEYVYAIKDVKALNDMQILYLLDEETKRALATYQVDSLRRDISHSGVIDIVIYPVHNCSTDNQNNSSLLLVVDSSKEYQKVLGFGGAFTDATGINVKSLPTNMQEEILKSYYTKEGNINYTYI